MNGHEMSALCDFLECEIVPRYEAFDAAHRCDHAHAVMSKSLELSAYYPEVNRAMLLTAAAYHDLGLCEGREHHHEVSARIIRADERLRRWFTTDQINIIADAAEDHRASSGHAPRTIYGRLVAESDRLIDGATIIRRTIQYGFKHYPHLNKEQHYRRFLDHMSEKYAEGGYLRLWIPESDNARRLARFRQLLRKPEQLRAAFDATYDELTTQSLD